MASKFGLLLTCLALLVACGCDSQSGGGRQAAQGNARQQGGSNVAGAQPTTSPSPADKSGGSCALIEASEVASVQGAQVRGATPSDRQSGNFAISQCYYTVASADGTKNLSVHLELTRGSKGGPPVREFWEEKFGREAGEEHEKGGKAGKKGEGEREEEESAPPQRVPGVGEEAFWLGNPKAGALYVLKGDNIVRVSVGGPDDVKTKIEKSKRLAAFALKRIT
ncbi:MAG TPA: hypothetical protein VF659_14755 [Pyrinomonadaceae bacterium]|jgi:hypothetical protein